MIELVRIINDFMLHNPVLVTWTVVVLMLILGFLLQLAWIKEFISERSLHHLLNNFGIKSLHNVVISDGEDENIFIEYLVLTPNNILLLGIKKFRGLIFAAESIDLWTQVIGNKSYKFENPLRQLENDTLVLNTKIENTKIKGKVLFIKGSSFPKGKPDDVISISDLKAWSKEFVGQVAPATLQADWEQLIELTKSNNLDKEILIADDKSIRLNIFSLLITIVSIVLWIMWRL